jgi:hypothetical protein
MSHRHHHNSHHETATAGRRYDMNSLAFQVNGHDGAVPRGSVRAVAVSPSGLRRSVDVIETEDGTYSANFTPNESGQFSNLLFFTVFCQSAALWYRIHGFFASVEDTGTACRLGLTGHVYVNMMTTS